MALERIGNIGPSPTPRDSEKARRVAASFEKDLAAYVATLVHLNSKNLDAQLPGLAHRTIELHQKAKEAQVC